MFWQKNLKERDSLKELSVECITALQWTFKKNKTGDLDWNDMALGKGKWLAVGNSVMNLWIKRKFEQFLSG